MSYMEQQMQQQIEAGMRKQEEILADLSSCVSDDELLIERNKHMSWIWTDGNGGRLTGDSSMELDLRLDLIDEIDQLLKSNTL